MELVYSFPEITCQHVLNREESWRVFLFRRAEKIEGRKITFWYSKSCGYLYRLNWKGTLRGRILFRDGAEWSMIKFMKLLLYAKLQTTHLESGRLIFMNINIFISLVDALEKKKYFLCADRVRENWVCLGKHFFLGTRHELLIRLCCALLLLQFFSFHLLFKGWTQTLILL